MNRNSTLDPLLLPTGQPAQAYPARLTRRGGWQPSADFILALAFVGDAVLIFAALSFGYWLRFQSGWIPFPAEMRNSPVPGFYEYYNLLFMGALFLLGTFGYLGLYTKHRFLSFLRTAKTILQGTIFWLFAFLAVSLILKFDPPISRLFTLSAFGSVVGAMLVWRALVFQASQWEPFAAQFRRRVLFVGWGLEAEKLAQEIKEDRRHPYEIIGCLPSPQGTLHPLPPGIRLLGDYQYLPVLLAARCADIVILADLRSNMGEIIGLSNLCEMEFAEFKVIPSYFQIFATGLRLESISGVPMLGLGELPLDRFLNRTLKRVIDLVGAVVGLVLSAPLMAIFGLLVWRESPGTSVFYSQVRMGKHGRTFKIYKIRSMRTDAEADGAQWAQENDPRRLKVGAFMRRWNIDEVPQFWNVLKGDMSLVGPRPERPELIEKFKHTIPHYHARHSCLPGISGWAQVNGWRGNTSLEERIRCDIWYVENWSPALDLRILVLTFLRQKNAY